MINLAQIIDTVNDVSDEIPARPFPYNYTLILKFISLCRKISQDSCGKKKIRG